MSSSEHFLPQSTKRFFQSIWKNPGMASTPLIDSMIAWILESFAQQLSESSATTIITTTSEGSSVASRHSSNNVNRRVSKLGSVDLPMQFHSSELFLVVLASSRTRVKGGIQRHSAIYKKCASSDITCLI